MIQLRILRKKVEVPVEWNDDNSVKYVKTEIKEVLQNKKDVAKVSPTGAHSIVKEWVDVPIVEESPNET